MLETAAHVIGFILQAAAGMLLPGWLLSWWLPSSDRFLSSFLGSALILFYLVLGFQLTGLPVTMGSMGVGLAVVIVVLLAPRLWRKEAVSSLVPRLTVFSNDPRSLWWALPILIGLSAIAARAIITPLSGFDNIFRWEFLARQILRTGHLNYYPPVSAEDYAQYGFCDGIPPLVAILNLWIYVSAGMISPVATAARVIFEGGLLFYSVSQLARRYLGQGAGWPAAAALSTCGLALWGVSMGQETGLTAITLLAMCIFLDAYGKSGKASDLVWAGAAAGAGGLSREYGMAWIFVGLAILAWQRMLGRSWKIFLFTSAALVIPWYLRNYLRTGNPLFSQSLGGLFPVPPVHQELMALIAREVGGNGMFPTTRGRVLYLAMSLGPLLTLGIAGAVLSGKKILPLVGAVAAVVALWFWSIPQTLGGYIYSSRVLTPALALLAVLGGALLLKFGRRSFWGASFLSVLAIEAAIRSFYFPYFLVGFSWNEPRSEWFTVANFPTEGKESQVLKSVAAFARGEKILVDQAPYQALLMEYGAHPVPIQSPFSAAIFDESLTSEQVLVRLQQNGIRLLLTSPDFNLAPQLSARHRFLAWLNQQPSLFRDERFALYDVQTLRGDKGVPVK
jgi:hypothetical protein